MKLVVGITNKADRNLTIFFDLKGMPNPDEISLPLHTFQIKMSDFRWPNPETRKADPAWERYCKCYIKVCTENYFRVNALCVATIHW